MMCLSPWRKSPGAGTFTSAARIGLSICGLERAKPNMTGEIYALQTSIFFPGMAIFFYIGEKFKKIIYIYSSNLISSMIF
jgi:hypothetical protein